jgi:dimethylamine monooxygenase subunit C
MTDQVSPDRPLPMVKSQPVYVPLSADPSARRHVLVAESLGLEAIFRVIDAIRDNGVLVEVYWLGSVPERLASHPDVYSFDSIALLSDALVERLAQAEMGLRLYMAGHEAFLWQINQVCSEMGLRDGEIQREACGSLARRVFCVHCRNLLEDVTTNPVPCPRCHVLLEVRDHFSRALAAYIGVVVNAEDPNDRPEPQEQFA